jgi:predicted MFS family arabinose efflux permease
LGFLPECGLLQQKGPLVNDTSKRHVAAIVAVAWAGSVSFLFISLQPFLVGAWIAEGMQRGDASAALSAHLFGGLVGNLAAIGLIARFSVKTLTAIGTIISGAALALAGFLPTQPGLLWGLLFAGGLGGGVLGAASAASAGALPHPGRAFAIIIASQIVSGSIALFVTPDILAAYGMSALFYGVAALTTLTLAFLPAFAEPLSRPPSGRSPSETWASIWSAASILLLVSLGLLYVGNNAVWSYLEQIGHHAGLPASDIGLALAIGQGISLAFAIAAAVFDRWNAAFAIMSGGVVMCTTAVLFTGGPSTFILTIGVAGFLGGVCFVVPYYMTALARRDATGRLMVWGQSAITIGLMIGPPVAAFVIDHSSLDAMVWAAIGITVVSTAVACLALASTTQRGRNVGAVGSAGK